MDIHHGNSFQNVYSEPIDCHNGVQLYGPSIPLNGRIEKSYSDDLCKLESFLRRMAFHHEMPALRSATMMGFRNSAWLECQFQLFPDFIGVVKVLPEVYLYHPYLNVFIGCCESMNLLGAILDWRTMIDAPYHRYACLGDITPVDVFNTLICKLYVQCQSSEVRDASYSLEYEARERFVDYCGYFNAIMDSCDKVNCLRLDVFYRKDVTHQIGLEELSNDLDHLIRNMRNNSLFDDLKGYIFKIEYGIDKGMHCHLTFFFNGSERNPRSHIHHTQQIGEYWVNVITKGRGAYWNCNAHANSFDKLGRRAIGLIHWRDQVTRQNVLEYVIGYACKPEQIIKLKSSRRINLIRRGKYPVVPPNKLGRPRLL